jgi:HSP20 family protein
MALVRWRPMSDLMSIQDEINRAFDEVWRGHGQRVTASSMWWPAVDLTESKNEFKLVAELPGMKRGDVKISLTENVLTLRGEKRARKEEENESWHQVERTYGSFERSFQLTCPVDPAKVKARFEDGVLTVVLPKSEESKPREIDIEG